MVSLKKEKMMPCINYTEKTFGEHDIFNKKSLQKLALFEIEELLIYSNINFNKEAVYK